MAAKEPMIDRSNRPDIINFDAPIGDWLVRDLLSVINSYAAEHAKHVPFPEELKPENRKPWPEIVKPEFRKPEILKPEGLKPERWKPEKEFIKPEKELFKGEKEFHKPEKELFKGEKEYTKPPDPFVNIEELVEQISQRVIETIRKEMKSGR